MKRNKLLRISPSTPFRTSLTSWPACRQAGFTLVEILVVISIMMVVGAIVVGIFTNSLRGATKVDNLTRVRQNGNFVMTQMVKTIRYATELEGVGYFDTSTPPDKFNFGCPRSREMAIGVKTTDQNNQDLYTRYQFDSNTWQILTFTSDTPFPADVTTPSPTPAPLGSNGVTYAGSFGCIVRDSHPVITINFTAFIDGKGLVESGTTGVDFHNSVVLRNITCPISNDATGCLTP